MSMDVRAENSRSSYFDGSLGRTCNAFMYVWDGLPGSCSSSIDIWAEHAGICIVFTEV